MVGVEDFEEVETEVLELEACRVAGQLAADTARWLRIGGIDSRLREHHSGSGNHHQQTQKKFFHRNLALYFFGQSTPWLVFVTGPTPL